MPRIMHTLRQLPLVLAPLALTATRPPAATSGDVTPQLASAGTMSVARAAHSATSLRDGRVLVAGGFTTQGSARGAELYDAATGRFTSVAPMVVTRHSHTATRLADGRVLLTGGYAAGTEPTASVEVFDPATGRFSAAAPLVEARANHVAVPLANGTVLIIGGLGPGWTFLSSAEIYDPATGRSVRTGAMHVPRESHVGVRLRDGRVLVIGGHTGRRADITLHRSAEMYDPSTGRFATTGDMGIRRHKHDAVLLGDGRVLVTGGSDERDDRGVYASTELYDPVRGTFTAGPSMLRGRYKHAGTSQLLPSGQVLLAGGAAEAELYDPASQRFTLVPGASTLTGQFSAVALLPGGGALITGGYGGGRGPQPAAWRFRP